MRTLIFVAFVVVFAVGDIDVGLLCLLCSSSYLQGECRPLVQNCSSPGCADCTAALSSAVVKDSCRTDPTACAFLQCGFDKCSPTCEANFCGDENVTTTSSSGTTAPVNYTTCDSSLGLCAASDRLCDPNKANDTFPLCNFCNVKRTSWMDGDNGCLNFGICEVVDAAVLAAQANVTLPAGTRLPMCSCQPPYIPPQCKLTIWQYYNADVVYNARWYLVVCACIIIIAAVVMIIQHIVLDKRRFRTIQTGTVYHVVGLSIMICSAVFLSLYFVLNFQGTWFGGYNGNFGWVYTSYLWLNLAVAADMAELGMIGGQWLNVFFVFVALARGQAQKSRPWIPYAFAVTIASVTIPFAFILAWASTVRVVWKYITIEAVIIGGIMTLLVTVTASYATWKFRHHAAKMKALGADYAGQTKKLLVLTLISILTVSFSTLISLSVFVVPDSAYAPLGGNIYSVSLYLPLAFHVLGWATALIFHSRADWKVSLLNAQGTSSTSRGSPESPRQLELESPCSSDFSAVSLQPSASAPSLVDDLVDQQWEEHKYLV